MTKLILCTILVLFLAHQTGKTQVVVNPDGSHSVVTGNVIVNPDGSHSVVTGNVIVNPNGSHSVIMGNVLVNADGSHSILHCIEKSTDVMKQSSALKSSNREPGDFKRWMSHLFGKTRNRNLHLDTLKFGTDTLSSSQKLK